MNKGRTRPTRTYIQHLCADTGCDLEDLLEAMDNRKGWQERVRDICADGVTWWWWWWFWARIVWQTPFLSRFMTGLNSEFFFSLIGCHIKEPSLPYLPITGGIHSFHKGISSIWNANILAQDLNRVPESISIPIRLGAPLYSVHCISWGFIVIKCTLILMP